MGNALMFRVPSVDTAALSDFWGLPKPQNDGKRLWGTAISDIIDICVVE